MVTGLILLIIFLIMALLMYLEKISTILVLPLMAFLFTVTAITSNLIQNGLPASATPEVQRTSLESLNAFWMMYWTPLSEIFAKGSVKLANVIITAILGGMLAVYIRNLKIAERMIYWTAEYAGDKAFGLGIALYLVTLVLFTSVGGLGSVIMIGTIILPILGSVGISPIAGAGIFLFGICSGGTINPGNLKFFTETFNLTQQQVSGFVFYAVAVYAFGAFVWMFFTIGRTSESNFGAKKMAGKKLFWVIPIVLATLAALAYFAYIKYGKGTPVPAVNPDTPGITDLIKKYISYTINAVIVLFFISAGIKVVVDYLFTPKEKIKQGELSTYSFIAPIVPVVLVFKYNIDPIVAFVITIAYTFAVSIRRSTIRMFCKSLIEGAQVVIPACVLMLGIGILVQAVTNDSIKGFVNPILKDITPSTRLVYIIGFGIAAPLALYRGPLNLWGLGVGLATLMAGSENIKPDLVMGMLIATGMIQGICDPTNTQNVWIASFQGTTPNVILRKTLPLVWSCAVILLIISAFLFKGSFIVK